MSVTKEQAQAALKKHGSIRKAARALGLSKTTLYDKTRAGRCVAGAASPSKVGRALSDFRANYDKAYIVPKRIREGLKKLGAGWEYEAPFAKAAGVSLSDLAAFRDAFAEYIVQLREGRRAWAGRKDVARQMREMI